MVHTCTSTTLVILKVIKNISLTKLDSMRGTVRDRYLVDCYSAKAKDFEQQCQKLKLEKAALEQKIEIMASVSTNSVPGLCLYLIV